MTPVELGLRFVDLINAHDVLGLTALMTEDHVFTDSQGARVVGRIPLRDSWEKYFRLVPDYQMEIFEYFVEGQIVVFLGTASGTYAAKGIRTTATFWEIPAAWRAEIIGNSIASWQVFADNEPLRRKIHL